MGERGGAGNGPGRESGCWTALTFREVRKACFSEAVWRASRGLSAKHNNTDLDGVRTSAWPQYYHDGRGTIEDAR